MQRFLILVGVAVVAAAMYVAASPASQQSRGPTAKQFKALKARVANIEKTLKTVKAEAAYIKTCLTTTNAGALPVAEFGDAQTHQFGYWYKSSAAGTPTWTTALDIDTSATPGGFLQIVDRSCVGGSTTVHRQLRSGR